MGALKRAYALGVRGNTLASELFLIDESVLNWRPNSDASGKLTSVEYLLPYQYHSRAEVLLMEHLPEARTDAVSNLKRAIDHRLKTLNEIYCLRRVPGINRKDSLLDILFHLGILKPRLLHEIKRLRNEAEHQFIDPADHERCLDLADLCWYLLRATDACAHLRINGVILSENTEKFTESDYWVEFCPKFDEKWRIAIRGWIPAEKLIMRDSLNGLQIQGEKEIAKKARDPNTEEIDLMNYIEKRNKKIGDMYISGEIVGSEFALNEISKKYFSLVHFGL